MASTASQSQSVEQVDKVQLKVMVDEKKNRVLWAEAGKDFVDVLFSFLTLPLGTIARLVSENSNSEAVRVGSLSSLYQSVADLKEEHLWTPTRKDMLLWPRNSMEAYCNKLKLNIDDTPMEYFFCENWNCGRKSESALLNAFRNRKCSCGYVMKKEVSSECLSLGNGFIKETASFIICDDLHVMPNAFGKGVQLLQKFGVHNFDAIEEQTVDIGKEEVIDILKLSLISKTPLTDLILKKKQCHCHSNPRYQSEFAVTKLPSNEGREMSVKVTIRKSTGEILLAEGESDFADFLFSFLTIPLGGVFHMLEASSSLSCIENLYKSLTEMNQDMFLCSKDLKDNLAKPQCFPQFELRNQILPIGVASLPVYYCHTYSYYGCYASNLTKEMVCGQYNTRIQNEKFVPFKLVDDDPKFSNSKSSSSGGFLKGPSLYMITDDLVVTPMSSASAFSFLNRSKVPLFDLEERVIKIGMKEGLCLLKASLFSTSPLTNALMPFISIVNIYTNSWCYKDYL